MMLKWHCHKPFRIVGEQPLVFISQNAPSTTHSNSISNWEFCLQHQFKVNSNMNGTALIHTYHLTFREFQIKWYHFQNNIWNRVCLVSQQTQAFQYNFAVVASVNIYFFYSHLSLCKLSDIHCIWSTLPFRLKEMSCLLEKQHDLLKLIIQKMEITSEADECDGPHNPRALKQLTSSSSQKSKWVPLLKAITAKKWY